MSDSVAPSRHVAPSLHAGVRFTVTIVAGLHRVVFDVPGQRVNTLGRDSMTELGLVVDSLERAVAAGACRGVIIASGKPGQFIAGAELSEFSQIETEADARVAIEAGQRLFDRIEGLGVPTACVIGGTCVGGGLELAMSCFLRVGERNPQAQIGLPEVKLGIVPAWGGTLRLPRWVGLVRALEMIPAGKLVDLERAKRWGLLDALVAPGAGIAEADRLVREAIATDDVHASAGAFAPSGGRLAFRTPRLGARDWFLGATPIGRPILLAMARRRVRAEAGPHYPAPIAAIECIETGLYAGRAEGLAAERARGAALLRSATSRNLVSIFFLTERIKKDKGVDGPVAELPPIERMGVLGAGVMGGGIAQLAATNQIAARVRDVRQAALDLAMSEAGRLFDQAVERRRLSARERANRQALISTTLALTGFSACQLVVEAVVEDLALKRKVLAEVETLLAPDAILASNTSSLSIDGMASALARPERFLGIHFFNPVHKMPLVEVVRGAKTHPDVVAAAVAFAKRLGKHPVVVKDSPGFLVNRVLMPLLDEGWRLVADGYSVESIDRALTDFGLPMGSFALLDTVGLDVAAKVARVFRAAFPERAGDPTPIERLVAAGHLGRKAKKGIYGKVGVDPRIWKVLGVAPATRDIDAGTCVDRVVLRMVAEAVRVLDEGVARSAADVDAGLIFGSGFAPFRGGLLAYADARELAAVVARLDELASAHGGRFAVPESLRRRAADGRALRDDRDSR